MDSATLHAESDLVATRFEIHVVLPVRLKKHLWLSYGAGSSQYVSSNTTSLVHWAGTEKVCASSPTSQPCARLSRFAGRARTDGTFVPAGLTAQKISAGVASRSSGRAVSDAPLLTLPSSRTPVPCPGAPKKRSSFPFSRTIVAIGGSVAMPGRAAGSGWCAGGRSARSSIGAMTSRSVLWSVPQPATAGPVLGPPPAKKRRGPAIQGTLPPSARPTGDPQLNRANAINLDEIRDQRAGAGLGGPGEHRGPAVGANEPPPASEQPGAGAQVSALPPAPPPGGSDEPKDDPVYKKWWFWGIVVVAGVVVYEIANDSSSNNNVGRVQPAKAAAMPGGLTLLRW